MTSQQCKGSGRTHKRCSRCGKVKPLAEFHKRGDGRTPQSQCKCCATITAREWTQKKSDQHRRNVRTWRANNYERAKAAGLKWRDKNREKLRYRARKAYHENAEKKREARRRYGASPAGRAKIRAYEARRRQTDVNYRLAKVLRERLREALNGGLKNGSAVKLLGCSLAEARSYIETRFEPGMSWLNWGISTKGVRRWHVDHKTPLSAFDLGDPEQIAAACHFTNLQPLWGDDNQRKGGKRK